MTRKKVFDLIESEREAQFAKWGEQYHNPVEWMAILMEEVGEASRESLELHFAEYYDYDPERIARLRKELVQVAAVAVQILEQI